MYKVYDESKPEQHLSLLRFYYFYALLNLLLAVISYLASIFVEKKPYDFLDIMSGILFFANFVAVTLCLVLMLYYLVCIRKSVLNYFGILAILGISNILFLRYLFLGT